MMPSSRHLWRNFLLSFLCIFMLMSSLGFARVKFETTLFQLAEFNDSQVISEQCSGPAPSSFWCGRTDDDLTLITSKGKDIFFNEVGEAVAIYVKQQRGQDMRGRYNLDNRQNLIPLGSSIPGAAILLDGEYFLPQALESSWREDGNLQIGEFRFLLGAENQYEVSKIVTVSAVSNTFEIAFEVQSAAGLQPEELTEASEAVENEPAEAQTDSTNSTENTAESSLNSDSTESNRTDSESAGSDSAADTASDISTPNLRLAFPGLAKNTSPVIKIGQGTQVSESPPLDTVVNNAAYASMQASPVRGTALVLTPNLTDENSNLLNAVSLPINQIAMEQADAEATGMRVNVFAGPNELARLYQEGLLDMPGLFKPNILGRLSLGIISLLELIHGFLGNWGVSILVLTLLIRLMIWPLMATQMKSMTGMQEIQPKIQALQKKYKDNREKLQQETMKLYQEAGVNPLGGCLPMFIQMPLLLMMWRVFMNFEFNEGFLWIPDLGLSDPTYLLPIIYVAIMFANSWVMSRDNPQALRQGLMMNAVFVFFIISFPSGVALYLVGSMVVQLVQQWLIKRDMNNKPPTPKPTSKKKAKTANA